MALDLRRSTVYDFSDLRLHRDGTRIHQTDRNYEASRKRKFSMKDARGKWRAKDAAGLGTVPRMRCANLGADSTREHEFEEQGEGQQLHAKRGRISLEEKKRGVQPVEHRTIHRWRFDESLDFLDGTPNGDPATSIEDKANLPVPSSELLKNVHYIAAEFYTERGQLLNLGKKYRADKKRKRKGKKSTAPRKKRRVDEATDAGADRRQTPDFDSDENRDSSSSDPDSGDSSDSSSPSEADNDNEFSVSAEEVEDTPSIKSTEERKKRYMRSLREIRQKHQQDMYRMMNGSALMVLGMLVQEHVAKLVRGKVPEGWEEGLPLEDEEEWSEEGEEQVESEREGEEDESEDDDEDIDSGMADEVADDNIHEEREIREDMPGRWSDDKGPIGGE